MFRHVGIVVKNLKKQLYFYKNILGFEVYYDKIEKGKFVNEILNLSNSEIHILKLGINGKPIIELLKFLNEKTKTTSKRVNSCGITHVAITVNNLDNVYVNLLKNKIKTFSKPKISENNKHKVLFCLDYEKNILELVENLS
jgi:catechol 2,3-dioxygenase-like lactoylglutathione lyase family enzyme